MKPDFRMNRVLLFVCAGFGCMTLAFGAALAGTPSPDSAAFSETIAYLRQNCEPLDLRQAVPEARLLETAGKRIFLLGEVHGVAVNNQVDFALLRYLHRVAGVRVYVSEISYSHAWYINRYLETGDMADLDFVFGQMRGFVDCSVEKRRFWIELKKWNDSLPPAERIRVVGIDLERMPGISLAYLRQQLAGRAVPANLRPVMDRLRTLAGAPSADAIRSLTAEMVRSVGEHRADYARFLGDRWFGFELALDNLQDNYRCRADKARYDFLRDRAMDRNFCRQAAQIPFATAYGRLGSDHVLQHRSGGVEHLSFLLNQPGSQWAGQVVGIWPLYEASSRLSFAHHRYGPAPCSDESPVVRPFGEATASEVTLFKLIGAHSPYAKNLLLPAEANEGVTTDYFQYVVLMKKAAADTPLDMAASPAPARLQATKP